LELPSPFLQLLFGTANSSIIDHGKIRDALRDAIVAVVERTDNRYVAPVIPTLVKLGLLPSLLSLASSGVTSPKDGTGDVKIREWARTQIKACGVKPVKPLEWVGLGLAESWGTLLSTLGSDESGAEQTVEHYRKQGEIWRAALAVVESSSLHPRTLEEFVLGSGSPNVLAILASRIADKTPGEKV
jgi:hypothetical protein